MARWYIPYTNDDAWAQLVVAIAPVTNGEVGPIIRTTSAGSDTSIGYYGFRYRASTGRLQLLRKDAGIASLVILGLSFDYILQNNDTLRIEVQGSTIRGLLNGTVVITAIDSTLPVGSTYH